MSDSEIHHRNNSGHEALLRQLNQEHNVTIITATHDPKMIRVSDRAVIIRDGLVDQIQNRAEIEAEFTTNDGH